MAFERISLEQGLSQTTVLCVFQDSRGFLWFGTEDGLNRYDGLSFKTYKYDPADSGSLPNNMVWAVVEDSQGDLWVGTEGGGSRALGPPDRPLRARRGRRPASRVRALWLGADGVLWIGTKARGLPRLDTRGGAVPDVPARRRRPGKPQPRRRVRAVVEGRRRASGSARTAAWPASTPRAASSTAIAHDPAANGEPGDDQRPRPAASTVSGRLWVGTYAGLGRLEPGAERLPPLPPRSGATPPA